MTEVANAPGSEPAYCRFYCEENVWQLCAHPSVAAAERRVLIISNAERRVAMWGQRAAEDPQRPIAWDYHVVLLVRQAQQTWQIWDLDAREPGPRAAEAWLQDSFEFIGLVPPIYAPRFRLITAADYRRHLRSDRRHMRQVDGSARKPPPAWPAIIGDPPACAPIDDGNNLERFLDTQDPTFLGELYDLAGLHRWLRAQHRADVRA